jgi:hypothetical protein
LGAGAAGFQGIFHGPGYYYLLGIPFILFQGNPAGGTVLMLLFGALSLIMAFVLGDKLFGKAGGAILLVLVGISPLFIAQSRFLWSPYPSTLFILAAFYFILKMKEHVRYIFLAAFFSAFIYNFELAIAVPMSIGLICYAATVVRKRRVINFIFLIAGLFLALLPMMLFEVRHGFMGVKGMISYLTSGHASHASSFGSLLSDHFLSFLYSFKDTFPPMLEVFLFLFGMILLSTFIFFIMKEKNKNIKSFMLFLAFLPVLNFFILAFLRNIVYPYYLYHISLIYLLIFTYCLVRAFKFKKIYIVLLVILFVLVSTAFITDFKMVRYDLYDYGGTAKLKGKIDAIDYIYKDARGKKFGLFIFSPPVYTYPYDYIIDWYGKKKYGYVPTTDKNGLFYLLINIDPDKPWSYNGWLQTVIKTGTIIKTVTLPSGFIVQVRDGSLPGAQ